MAPKARLQKLVERRNELAHEIEAMTARVAGEVEALRNQMLGLDMAMELLETAGEEPVGDVAKRRRESVKPVLIDMLQEVGVHGLNALIVVEMGLVRGVKLDRNTVSSLLSRLKRDGLVEFDGSRYRLVDATRKVAAAPSLPTFRELPAERPLRELAPVSPLRAIAR